MEQTGTLRLKRNWLNWRFKGEYKSHFSAASQEILELFLNYLETIIPSVVIGGTESGEALDIKGRDPHTIYTSNTILDKDELLFAEGKISSLIDENNKENQLEPFELKIYTEFKEFKDNSVLNSVGIIRGGAIDNKIPLTLIRKSSQIEIYALRLGLEKFQPSFVTNMFGWTPVVSDYFLFDYTAGVVQIEWGSDALKTKDSVPFEGSDLFSKVRKIFQEVFNLELNKEWQIVARSKDNLG